MLFNRSVRAGALAVLFCSVSTLAQAETLRQALTYAYLNNPTILSALLNVKVTAEGIASAKSSKLPSISGSVSGSQSYTFGSDSLSIPTVTVGASYSQTLFDNLQTDADIEAARALTEASRYSLQNSEQNVLLAVVQAYFNVMKDQQLVSLRQDSVTFYQAQVQSAQDKLDIGEGTRLDVSQAQARLASATASYQSAIFTLQTDSATYERYVGHKPQNLTSTYRLGSLLPKGLQTAQNEADASHPAILSAKASIRAAQANSDSAQAAFGPTLSLTSSISSTVFGENQAGTGPADPTPSLSTGLTLSIPIYGGGRYGSNIRKMNLSQIQSEVDALATRDEIRESLISAWSTLQDAKASIESANVAVESGELSLQGTIQERDVGQATTLDVLNAQSELVSTRETLISATASKAIAEFSVVAATGHLTAADLGLDVEIKTGEDYIAKVEDVWAELRTLE